MKKRTLLLLLPLLTLNLNAQIECEWDEYELYFELPEDFVITENDSEGFYAKGEAMEFGLFPFADAEIDTSDIAYFTLELAAELDLDNYDDADVLDDLNGLEGAYVEGELHGVRVILLGIIDPESDTNFFALIKFYDDDEVAEEDAFDIVMSIEPY